MNYTQNYHLPQWVKSDRVLMEDFNRMCQDMEAGLNSTASNAAAAVAKARADASSALEAARTEVAAAAAKAQSTANTAVSKADAAQATANAAYCPGKLPYAVGTYTGTGELGVKRPVTVGFKPRFVLVTARVTNAVNVHVMGGEGITDLHPINLTEDGFTALQYNGWPEVNERNVQYIYLAFR